MRKRKICVVLLTLLFLLGLATTASAAKMKLNKTSATIFVKKTVQLKVKGTKKKVSWSSTNSKVAKVNKKGKVTGVKAGTATINAKVGKTTFSCKVTVKAIGLSETNVTLEEGTSKKLTLNGTKIKSVSTSAKSVAQISKSGKITAVKEGTCKLTIKGKNGKKYTCKVTVIKKQIKVTGISLSQSSVSLSVGQSVTLSAAVSPGNASNQAVSWSTDQAAVATVDQNGVVTAAGAGSATITVTALDGSGKSASCAVTVSKPVIKATGVKLSTASAQLAVGDTLRLAATVEPENADNKSVTWSSSNASAASVDGNGVVTAQAAGEASIIATAADGSGASASCSITVTASEPEKPDDASVITSPDQTGNIKTLAEAGAAQITIQSDENTVFTIPAGEYLNTSLVVNAPNGEVRNQAKFQQITVQAISNNTYIEQAEGNTIVCEAPSGTIKVDGSASASVQIAAQNSDVTIVNDGMLSNVILEQTATVNITGAKKTPVSVEATAAAGDSRVITDKNLRLTAESKVNLQLKAGAEHTTAQVADDVLIPEVEGLGSVTVTNTGTQNVETVIAENRNALGSSERKVKVSGQIRLVGEIAEAIGDYGDIAVYLIDYSKDIVVDRITDSLGGNETATDKEGKYTFADVPLGNYYLVAVKEGYESVVQTLKIESDTGDQFLNAPIEMAPVGEADSAGVLISVRDASGEDYIHYPVLLKIRKGQDNISGPALHQIEAGTGDKYQYVFDNLTAGTYTIQVVNVPGSETTIGLTYFNVTAIAGEDVVYDVAVSRILPSEGMRFVLQWNGDADGAGLELRSHLIGPTKDNMKFHAWDYEEEYCYDGEVYANLTNISDNACASTIYQMMPGVYSYYVHDYTDRMDEKSTAMSDRSGAYVQIYDGESAVPGKTVYIPHGQSGNLWHVCDYDSNTGELRIINQVEEIPADEGENIASTPLDVSRRRLYSNIQTLKELCVTRLNDEMEELKAEVEKALSDAETLLQESEDETALNDMADKLDDYIMQLEGLPDLVKQQKMEQAISLELDQPVPAHYTGEELYFSFMPQEDGEYTVVLAGEAEGTQPSAHVLEGSYINLGDFIETPECVGERNAAMTINLTQGTRCLFAVAAGDYRIRDAQYSVYITRENRMRDLSYAIADVTSLADEKLADGPERTEVDQDLEEAQEILAGIAKDRVAGSIEKLQKHIEALKVLPYLDEKQGIDNASEISLDMPVTVRNRGKAFYYSFTPETDGEYLFVLFSDRLDSDEAGVSLYHGYEEMGTERLDDYCERQNLKAGEKYTCGIYDGFITEQEKLTFMITQKTDLFQKLSELQTAIKTLASLYGSKYIEEVEYKVSVLNDIRSAKEIVAAMNVTAVDEMLDKLNEHIARLEDLPSTWLAEGIANATPLQLDQPAPLGEHYVLSSEYFSFTPETDGEYTLIAKFGDNSPMSVYLSFTVYQGYQQNGGFGMSAPAKVNVAASSTSLSANVQYTFEALGYFERNGECSLTITKGTEFVGLPELISSLQDLCDTRLEEGDYKTEILGALAEAKAALLECDKEAASRLSLKLSEYITDLQSNYTDITIRNAVDGATVLELDQPVTFTGANDMQYFGFTPEKAGNYMVVLECPEASSGVYENGKIYKGYEEYGMFDTFSGVPLGGKCYVVNSFMTNAEAHTQYTFGLPSSRFIGNTLRISVTEGTSSAEGNGLGDLIYVANQLRMELWIRQMGTDDKNRYQAKLDQAGALLSAMDKVSAVTAAAELEGCLTELRENYLDSSDMGMIDNSLILTLNNPVPLSVIDRDDVSSRNTYYRFIPDSSGQYEITIAPQNPDAGLVTYCIDLFGADYVKIGSGPSVSEQLNQNETYIIRIPGERTQLGDYTITVTQVEVPTAANINAESELTGDTPVISIDAATETPTTESEADTQATEAPATEAVESETESTPPETTAPETEVVEETEIPPQTEAVTEAPTEATPPTETEPAPATEPPAEEAEPVSGIVAS